MDFVDHKKVAVFHLKAGEHRLVHRADCNGRGQKPCRVFSGPTLRSRFSVIVPSYAPLRQTLSLECPCTQHAGNRQHGLWGPFAERPAQRLIDPAVKLPRRGACRHREVKARNLSRGPTAA